MVETKCKGEKEIFECEISFSNSTLLKNQRKIKEVGRRTFFLVKCMEISKKNTTFIFRKIACYSCAAMTTADCSLYCRHLLILLTVLIEKKLASRSIYALLVPLQQNVCKLEIYNVAL